MGGAPPARPARSASPEPTRNSESGTTAVPTTGTTAVPTIRPTVSAAIATLRERNLVLPVAGVRPTELVDSFDEPRDGGRKHNAIDILAPRGTPILSADDGRILRMSTSELGGISMYTADAAGRFVYYYAHMERYAAGRSVGERITKGDTLGFVGTTGDAPKNVPHLHFQIMLWPDDGKYWIGEPINPYPILKPPR